MKVNPESFRAGAPPAEDVVVVLRFRESVEQGDAFEFPTGFQAFDEISVGGFGERAVTEGDEERDFAPPGVVDEQIEVV